MTRPQKLSCHCGSIRIEVDSELGEVIDCNCSTCARHGNLHWYVPAAFVRLLTESRPLATYVWRFLHEGHHFVPLAVHRSCEPDTKTESFRSMRVAWRA
jgi:hypothetical protein